MSNSIRISSKYEVNATMGICFFCGRKSGKLAFLNHINTKKDAKLSPWDDQKDMDAPLSMDYQPCDQCIEDWKNGVACIGVIEEQPEDGRPPIQKSGEKLLYPTGDLIVIEPEAISCIFETNTQAGTMVLMDYQMVQKLIEARKESER